ncbi:hypothetical protein RI129_001425 [Pyrocoelia pectoralis]|uniref:Prefoldin subunit 2 n=1 Tax=Pyrocoelia pectoralis TaxID=417401 RepID=A0AAN7VTR8_9COLE
MSNEVKKTEKKSTRGPTAEDIMLGFQQLRGEQRSLASKLSEFEMELNEHRLVIETLKNADPNRKCYRMIGGILVEKQVKDVEPVLRTNRDRLTELIEKVNEQLVKKGTEINEYRERYNIRIRGQDDLKQEGEKETKSESRGNVLVS